jgi:hypothetical protein
MENIFYDGYYLLLSHVNVIPSVCYIKDNNILLYFTSPEQHQMTKKNTKEKDLVIYVMKNHVKNIFRT